MNPRRFSLDGRVALITGASAGIGESLAEALAAAGAAVILVARRADRLERAAARIRDGGGEAAALRADLADLEGLPAAVERAIDVFGRVDILVNAAGVNLRQPVDEVTLEGWRETLDLHLSAPFFLAREVVADMKRRGWGRIINLASLQSRRAFADSLPYGAAKGGLVQMTRAMALAWSPYGVNCNAIGPGFFPTELTEPVFADPEWAAAAAAQTMIGRNGELDDLHGAAIFFASEASDYITGQTLFVDGGFTAK